MVKNNAKHIRKKVKILIPITDKEFQLLSEFIQSQYGIQLKKEKQLLLTGRLHKLVAELGFTTFTEYYDYLINDPTGEARDVLIDKVSTNHTYFMREADHFDYFRDQVLPYLKEQKQAANSRDIRIWCAASSTGEEPYTLAMIMADFFGNEASQWDTRLLATDISQTVLETAQNGVYDNESIDSLPNSWKQKYFRSHNSRSSVIVDAIRKNVIFRRFNLMEEVIPFKKKFDVIFCRNVMIYFDQPTKNEIANKMYNKLETGGYVFIGLAESFNRETNQFKYIKPAIYRKLD